MQEGSSAKKVWDNLWDRIKGADVFISHPVHSFVPPQVDMTTVGWMPATTDWLDGLNKDIPAWDQQYYFEHLRQICQQQGAPELAYPQRPYITQIARFDPAKGIPDVLKAYSEFRKVCDESKLPANALPQLIVCGHGSIDDPDASRIYHEATDLIGKNFSHLKNDIILARIGPSDQVLDTILSCARVVLQLSTREGTSRSRPCHERNANKTSGFEVKVSEALHKGKPVIACRTGGIPLQIEDGKSGFIVERGDTSAVAARLADLLINDDHEKLYSTMSEYAKSHVSDEVHTVGNAVAWTFLATALADGGEANEGDMVKHGEKWRPGGKWVTDLAYANLPESFLEGYEEDIPRLPRHLTT
jgi:alpha,alpha-trehalose phosphorylase (configuration-retaining)